MIKAMNAKKGKRTSTGKRKNYNGRTIRDESVREGKRGKEHKVQNLINLKKVQKC